MCEQIGGTYSVNLVFVGVFMVINIVMKCLKFTILSKGSLDVSVL
jgi:hypothetical protein